MQDPGDRGLRLRRTAPECHLAPHNTLSGPSIAILWHTGVHWGIRILVAFAPREIAGKGLDGSSLVDRTTMLSSHMDALKWARKKRPGPPGARKDNIPLGTPKPPGALSRDVKMMF